MKTAQSLAKMLGKSSSSTRLRMNEGIRMLDAGQDIDRLAGFSRGRFKADDTAIEQAGQIDPVLVLAGKLLLDGLSWSDVRRHRCWHIPVQLEHGRAGIAASTGKGMSILKPIGGGMGLKMTGASSGFKMPASARRARALFRLNWAANLKSVRLLKLHIVPPHLI